MGSEVIGDGGGLDVGLPRSAGAPGFVVAVVDDNVGDSIEEG